MPPSPRFRHDAPAHALIAGHGGRATHIRVALVDALFASGQPLTHDEIAAALDAAQVAHDRVTLYRALAWLVERGLARRVPGEGRAGYFEAARENSRRHAHFHCNHCGRVTCLENLAPAVAAALPEGYRLDHAELALHGACAACRAEAPAHP
ncbi:MAG: transcriptional repressor [Azoarcus sp.]|jgi:Fur family ferric uptake transcriptional regulator|nr:transcriptional repressor [Azoarcus sp.]